MSYIHKRLSDWCVDRLASTCIWERSVGAFIYCQQRLNQAEHQTPTLSRLIPLSGLQRDGETAGGYDTPLYSLRSVWGGYLSVLHRFFSTLPHRSIFPSPPSGHLRQSGGVDWCPFRLPDPSFPFSSAPPYFAYALILLCHLTLLPSLPSLINESPLLSFPLQSL